MPRRLRVLLIAEAANPEWVSVPLIGWSLSRAIAQLTDAHMVTHVRNRQAIERAGLVEGRDFTAIDNEQVAGPLWRFADRIRGGAGKGWTTMTAFSALAYYSFEREVWRVFGARIQHGEFDVVHRITPLSPTHQSTIAKRVARCGVAFVLGPLNGGVPWPKGFHDRQHAEREWLSHVRTAYKLMPGYHASRKHAAAIIAGSQHTHDEMPSEVLRKCSIMPENGIDPERFNQPRSRSSGVPLRGAFVGRLVPYKGADMLLEAAAPLMKDGKLKLDVVGDGPQRPELQAMVARDGVASSVQFHGWLPHAQVQNVLRECDFLSLPSVREFGGGVVLEAMALGVAPIVADYAGPAELVDDSTGIRIPFATKDDLIAGTRAALTSLTTDPTRLDTLGAAARRKAAQDFTWAAKARKIIEIYRQAMATGA